MTKFVLNFGDKTPQDVISSFYFPKKEKKKSNTAKKCEDVDDDPLLPLLNESSKKYSIHSDANKHDVKVWYQLKDFNPDYVSCMPRITRLPCEHCRLSFNTCPIGIPLRYFNEGTMTNEQSENVKALLRKQNYVVNSPLEFFFVVDNFCSFPCAQSEICKRSRSDSMYRQSSHLLLLMYSKLKGTTVTSIPCAPPHTMLKDVADGPMSIEQFTASIGKLMYLETSNLQKPMMFASLPLIEEYRLVKET